MAKKKYYLTLDTETATLPYVSTFNLSTEQKKKVAIAKPLVYDIGWVITDRAGIIIKEVNYLVTETFLQPMIFNTAYYSNKRPIYIDMIDKGLITVKNWNDIATELKYDLQSCDIACAYNGCFDFKKAIPFTEEYINALYGKNFATWETMQKKSIYAILNNKSGKNPNYLTPYFDFRGNQYPIADLWAIACDRLINIDRYRDYCLTNDLLTNSGEFFKTSAETSFQYLMKDYNFIESHTALADSIIESQILTKALKKGKVEPTLKAFPFKELGTTYDYATLKPKYLATVKSALYDYLSKVSIPTSYSKKIENIYNSL